MRPHKISRVSLVDSVCDQMTAAIRSGVWKPGEKVPSESELADQFGVNRLTVRMALQKLNVLGLLSTRIGDGTYVMKPDFSSRLQSLTPYYMNPEMVDDVVAFRIMIESACVDLARENATEEDVKKLQAAAKLYAREVKNHERTHWNNFSEDLEGILDADYNFHATLVQCSHNSLMEYAFSVAKAPIFEYLKALFISRSNARFQDAVESNLNEFCGLDSHNDICDYIEGKTDDPAVKEVFIEMIDYKKEYWHKLHIQFPPQSLDGVEKVESEEGLPQK